MQVEHELALLELESTTEAIPRENETSDPAHPPWVRDWLGHDLRNAGVDYLKLAETGCNIDIKVCVSRHSKITIKPKDLDPEYEIFMVITAAKHHRYGYRVKQVWFVPRDAILAHWHGTSRSYWRKFLAKNNLFECRSPAHAKDLFERIRWGDPTLKLAQKHPPKEA